MSDLPRYLPLSNRPRRDESDVSSHWGGEIATVLRSMAHHLAAAGSTTAPDAWDRDSLHPGWSVRDVVAHLVWRLSASRGQVWRTRTLALIENAFSSRAADTAIAKRSGTMDTPAELLERVRDLAAESELGRGRVGIRELSTVVIGGLDIAGQLGFTLDLPARASGAVALRRALEAPVEITAVIRGYSLAATDAEWSFGQGPELRGTAVSILLFLYGRSDVAPRRVG